MVNNVGLVISKEEDLALGPGTRLDQSRAFVLQSFVKVWKGAEKASDIDIRRVWDLRLESAPSLVFSKELYLKGSGQEELPYFRGQGQWPRVPGCDGAGTAESSYPTSKVRGSGWKPLSFTQGQGWLPGWATPGLSPGAAAGRSKPMSKEWWLHRHRRA